MIVVEITRYLVAVMVQSSAINSASTDVTVPPIVANSGGGAQQQSLSSGLNKAIIYTIW